MTEFVTVVFDLAQGLFEGFQPVIDFFTRPNWLQGILDTLASWDFDLNILNELIDILDRILPEFLTSASFGAFILYLGVPLILALSFVKWLVDLIPIL